MQGIQMYFFISVSSYWWFSHHLQVVKRVEQIFCYGFNVTPKSIDPDPFFCSPLAALMLS